MRIGSVVIVFAICSVLAGCGPAGRPGAEPAPSSSPPATVSPSASSGTAGSTPTVATPTPSIAGPTASPTPTSSPTSTSTPSLPAESSTADVLTFAGYGQLRLGLTAGEGTRQGIVRPVPDGVCGAYEVTGPYADEPIEVVFGTGEELVQVTTNRPGPATWKGAQVGMTWSQVRERHPDAEIVAKEGNGGTFYAAQIRGEGAMILFFAVSERDPDNWYGGTLMTTPDWPDAQTIRAMAVMPSSDGVYGGC